MGYRNLRQCLDDLEANGDLLRIEKEVDPDLEAGAIQRRVLQAGGPALMFSRVTGCRFPLAGNLFGTRQRLRFIFRDTLRTLEPLLERPERLTELLTSPQRLVHAGRALWRMRSKTVRSGPLLKSSTQLSALPRLKSWPLDGGGFVTLPQVYSQDPDKPGPKGSNLGMYRVQLDGNRYAQDCEAGLHYQIHRGIGTHHTKALMKNRPLPVNVFVGGPPAMTLAAMMPMPGGIPETAFASVLAGHRIPFVETESGLPAPAEADFCISGLVHPGHLLPEGPFGDHLGYYSLKHDFPVLSVQSVRHRPDAVWPFTTVGRPPQEDSVFGQFVHQLTGSFIPMMFPGVHELNAVDEAGVHPLLLAVGSERYVPFAEERIPQELLTNAHALLGNSQTSLSKYLIIAAKEDDQGLSAHDAPGFFRHVLERVDWRRDVHFITRTTMDTLDYSGISLNQGSKAIIAACGNPRRSLSDRLPAVDWPERFQQPSILAPGILILQGPAHDRPRDTQDPEMTSLCHDIAAQSDLAGLPLLVVVDDSRFTAASWENFLWVTFTRSDPATDIYGMESFLHCKHWGCHGSLVVDARLKSYHAPPLEADPDVERRVDRLGEPGGPLHGII